MKQYQFRPLILFLFLIISAGKTSARFPPTKQTGSEGVKLNETTGGNSDHVEIEDNDSSGLQQLMGGEEDCGSGDEECLKRRVVAEAHLDYIYTQGRRKPTRTPTTTTSP
ncbi:putative phytosulfokines 6 [Malania oleifera]|uniref:putative phytosulfokines 6 n=1 Tax=Malania oleifera TaxID=397392 RepID=UPI0025ADA43D|nr:putative phytosulfokines 6 [Malania oleifera]